MKPPAPHTKALLVTLDDSPRQRLRPSLRQSAGWRLAVIDGRHSVCNYELVAIYSNPIATSDCNRLLFPDARPSGIITSVVGSERDSPFRLGARFSLRLQ